MARVIPCNCSHRTEVNRALRVDQLPEREEPLAKSMVTSSCGFTTGSVRRRTASTS